MTTFDLGPGCRIDLSRLTDSRMLLQANSGGGKSWLLRRLLEQTHGKVQQLVIDPEGEFASLRERFDYVHAAKQGADTAADPRSAKLLAERLLELGVSAILDIYELKAHDRIRFVRSFLEAMVDAPKSLWHPALVVVDEAHVFCPQVGEAESAGAVIDLATRGRKRGYCAVLATQRLSKLHKDAAAELNNKLIGRTGLDVDVKRAADELGFAKDRWVELRRLTPGHFFAFGPAISEEVREVQVGPVTTTHPKAGSRLAFVAPPPTSKIKALLPKLADLPAEAEQKQKSLDDLKQENTTLRRQLTVAQRTQPAPPEPAKPIEVPVLGEDVVRRVEQAAERVVEASNECRMAASAAQDAAGGFFGEAKGLLEAARRVARPLPAGPRREAPCLTPRQPHPDTRRGQQRPAGDGGALATAQQKLINAMAYLEALGLSPADKTQVSLFADLSPTAGYTQNMYGRLRTAGLIDYPGPGSVALTDAGRELAAPADVPQTPEEMHARLYAKLPAAQSKILRVLIQSYPNPMVKEQASVEAGLSPTAGYTQNMYSRLRSLGLIDYPTKGEVVALPVLFLEGQ